MLHCCYTAEICKVYSTAAVTFQLSFKLIYWHNDINISDNNYKYST